MVTLFRLLDPRAHHPATRFLESGRGFMSNRTNPRRDLFRHAPQQGLGYSSRQKVLWHRWWGEGGPKSKSGPLQMRRTTLFVAAACSTEMLDPIPGTRSPGDEPGDSWGKATILPVHHVH